MADETLRFDILGEDHLSGPLERAARGAEVLNDALKRQDAASRFTAGETLALARAVKNLEDAEHGLRNGALAAEFALKRQADAARKAAEENRGLQASLQKLADSAKGAGGPAFLGPALLALPAAVTLTGALAGAAAGLAGAFTAGAGALLAFGAVAKPVLSDALKAQAAVNTAQNNYTVAIANGVNPAKAYRAEQIAIGKAYAEMSPQQIALSQQLGNMAQAWQDLKAAQTPVVAGALVPWLQAVTDLTGKLAPIIAAVSPVIRDLGFGFDALINSPQFKAFQDFIANTGSAAVGAIGGTLIDLIDAFIVLLPKFNPLIEKAVGWIAGLGPAVLHWAASQKTADQITKFMAWFSTNGPVLGGLLKNIGAALANLAPGLTAGGTAELKVVSDFFGFIAKLPKGIAGPLAETAGALLLLNKLGVISVGVKIIGPAVKWLTGGLINIGGGATAGAEIRAAMVSGGAAAAAEIRAAMTGAAAPAAGAAGKGAPGAFAALGAAAGLVFAGAFIGAVTRAIGDYLSPQGTFAGNLNKQIQNLHGPLETSILHTFTFGGIEAKLTASIGLPVGKMENDILAGAKIWGKNVVATVGGAFLQLGIIVVRAAKAITDSFLNMVSIILNGAAKAFGWIPGLGGKLRGAAADFSTWRAGVNSDFDRVIAKMQGWQNQLATSTGASAAATKSIGANFTGVGVIADTTSGKVLALNTALTNLPAKVAVSVTESGTGTFTISQLTGQGLGVQGPPPGVAPPPKKAAAGMYVAIGSGPAADDVLIRASRGELVVPAHLVAGGMVDHLKGLIPGFAAGGSIGALAGATTGFHDRFVAAVTAALEAAMAAAMRAAIKVAEAAAAVAGGGGPVSAGAAQAQAYARSRLGAYGWGADQMPYLIDLWNLESGWNRLARNPSSGAYGIPQAYPASKMGAAANPPTSSAGAQIDWGLGYISSVYGTPAAADATEHRIHAYDRGGWLRPGLTLAVNTTGRPEQVIPGGGLDALAAELRALRAEVRQLTGVAAAIPERTGRHVAAGVNGAAASASFRVRYP